MSRKRQSSRMGSRQSRNRPNEVVVPSLEHSDEEDSVPEPTPQSPRTSRKYFRYALLLWIVEFLVVIGCKRFGLINRELEESILQTVMPQIEQGLHRLNASIPSWGRINATIPLSYQTGQKERPGYQLAQQGAKANYPVVIVPGFVTSGLTVWAGNECARRHFRQRLWAAFTGGLSFLMDRECWRNHMMLDLETGGDPENIRLRAAEGFEAADYFMANYWVFGKIIENLADLGYTPSEMSMEPYDWRLAFPLLEERDGYFTKLKTKIEGLHKTKGKKVVLTSHSMGALVIHYFFNWVTTSESKGGGGGGRNWVDKHIHAYINIAGAHLGVPKASTALLSGEMSDTVFMGTMGHIMEQFFGRKLRRDLWTTWGSLWAMQPMGGDDVWRSGYDMCSHSNESDLFCPEEGKSHLIVMNDSNGNTTSRFQSMMSETTPAASTLNATIHSLFSRKAHSVTDVVSFIQDYGASHGPTIANAKLHALYSDDKDPRHAWHDPTRTPLPHAPSMKIYCMYGRGLDTERAYVYTKNVDEGSESGFGEMRDPPIILATEVEDEYNNVEHGIRYSDGDGSVPLLSLGYVCTDAWRRKETGLNPSGAEIFTREYEHHTDFRVDDPMRGGPKSSDHVDILGNIHMTEDFLRVVSDFGTDEINSDSISSDIVEISSNIADSAAGRLKRRKRWI